MELAALKNEVATLCCETQAVEFKSGVHPRERAFWVQIIRSVLAMHNNGGGVIVFGLNSVGQPVESDLAAIRAIDPIQISDKARHYTERPLPDIKCEEFEKNGGRYPGWIIPSALIPVPFSTNGEIQTGNGKVKQLFYPGQIYIRRGASSAPADAGDMERIAERIRKAAREEFASQMTGLVSLPPGHEVKGVPAGSILTIPTPSDSIRLIDDPSLPAAVGFDMHTKFRYRQKELIANIVTRIPGCRVNPFDIQCIKRVYEDEFKTTRLFYLPPHASPRYSDDTVDWIAGKIGGDPAFFEKTRAAYKNRPPASKKGTAA